MANLGAILEAAGSSFDKVVKTTILLVSSQLSFPGGAALALAFGVPLAAAGSRGHLTACACNSRRQRGMPWGWHRCLCCATILLCPGSRAASCAEAGRTPRPCPHAVNLLRGSATLPGGWFRR